MGLSIARHLGLYRLWSRDLLRPGVVRFAMGLGVPLAVFSSAILAAVRSTRGLALAALPLQLFAFLFTWHKAESYVVHECVLFAGALAVGGLVCFSRIFDSMHPELRRWFPSAAAVTLGVCLIWGSPMLATATVSMQPKVHEVELARAASRQILGPDARVPGWEAAWFSPGAAYSAGIQAGPDTAYSTLDVSAYFSKFDAAIGSLQDSGSGPVGAWYADGTLKLRGFFFGETSDRLRLVFLTARSAPRVVGYAARDGQLFRFQDDPDGDYQVLSAVCPQGQTPWLWPWRRTFSSILRFSQDSPEAGRLMVTILAPRSAMFPPGEIGRGCREVSKTSGTFEFAHREALLASLPQGGPPVDFHRIQEQLTGYGGM